jgi:hypothetical protein
LFLLIAAIPIASAEPVRPPAQAAFLAAVTQARDQFKAARNDMERSEARVARKTAICLALPQHTARDWIGRIYRLSSNSEGNVVVGIAIGPEVYVTTWNNSISDIGDNTLIPPGSPVFQGSRSDAAGRPRKGLRCFYREQCRLRQRDQLDSGRFYDRARVRAEVLPCQPCPVN